MIDIYSSAASDSTRVNLAPPSPLGDGVAEGYLQVVLTTDGRISVRGSRALTDWLLRQLASDGWQIELDQIRWCG